MQKKWKLIRLIGIFIFSVVFVYSGIQISMYIYDGYNSKQSYEKLKNQYYQFERETTSTDEEQSELEEYDTRFESLRKLNTDIIGWISIDNTLIDYPVVQSTDNDFYLTHNVDKDQSSRGAIFMDYRNSYNGSDNHTVIYGHDMKDGTMFGGLTSYKELSFYREHPYIELDLLEGSSKWEVFSVYIYKPEDTFFQLQFANEVEYSKYIEMIKQYSLYDTGVQVSNENQLLTLVTCTYEVTDARLVIHAKKI